MAELPKSQGVVDSSLAVAISPRGVMRITIPLILFFVAMGVLCGLLLTLEPRIAVIRVLQLFHLDTDANLPTYFSAMLLLASALALGSSARLIRESEEPWFPWAALAVGFLLLSIDEVAMMHERVGMILKNLSPEVDSLGGFLNYKWVLVGIPVTVAVAFAFLPWFLTLRPRLKLLFAVSGTLFLGGAIGVEMINGYIADTRGTLSTAYVLVTAVEESLEMFGAALFLYALLEDLQRRRARLTFEVVDHSRKAALPIP